MYVICNPDLITVSVYASNEKAHGAFKKPTDSKITNHIN